VEEKMILRALKLAVRIRQVGAKKLDALIDEMDKAAKGEETHP
jgi:hypothetical protein